jgi:hypothetical protein
MQRAAPIERATVSPANRALVGDATTSGDSNRR